MFRSWVYASAYSPLNIIPLFSGDAKNTGLYQMKWPNLSNRLSRFCVVGVLAFSGLATGCATADDPRLVQLELEQLEFSLRLIQGRIYNW